jgi:hypothetical protein
MDVHKNARTTPHSRALIAQRVAAGERAATAILLIRALIAASTGGRPAGGRPESMAR